MLALLIPLGFLALFQVIGGLAAGSGLRTLFVNHAPGGVGLLIWGLGFGGIPALMAIGAAVDAHQPLLSPVGPLLFAGALAFGMLLLPWIVQEYGTSTLISMAAGCAFLLFGGLMAIAVARSGTGQTIIGVIAGAVFALVGLFLCWTAISSLISGKTLDGR